MTLHLKKGNHMATATTVLVAMIAFQLLIYGIFTLGRKYEKQLKEKKECR